MDRFAGNKTGDCMTCDWTSAEASVIYELEQKAGRETPRHSCRLKVRYRTLQSEQSLGLYHQEDVYQDGWLRNRSEGGVMLQITHYIAVDKKLELNYTSPDGSRTFRAEAVVCWVNKTGARRFHIGLRFEKLLES